MCQVLVVEDDPTAQSLLGELFEREGFDVALAGDGLQAIEAIQRARPDLIVSDIMMPNLSGVRLVELLRTQGAHVPVILLTGLSDPPAHGADVLVRKPFSIDDLLSQVGSVMRDKHVGNCAQLCEGYSETA